MLRWALHACSDPAACCVRVPSVPSGGCGCLKSFFFHHRAEGAGKPQGLGKRVATSLFRAQGRGGKGRRAIKLNPGDALAAVDTVSRYSSGYFVGCVALHLLILGRTAAWLMTARG